MEFFKVGHAHKKNSSIDAASKPALFLDRDGVMIHNDHYPRDPSIVKLNPSLPALLRRAHSAQWLVVVVTNQSGIGRGLLDLESYRAVNAEMFNQLRAFDSPLVHRVYFCPFYFEAEKILDSYRSPEFEHFGIIEKGRWDSFWRKPNPGMLFEAARDLNINLSASVMVGDRISDMEAAFHAGLKNFYFIRTEALVGKVLKEHSPSLTSRQDFKVMEVNSLDECELLSFGEDHA